MEYSSQQIWNTFIDKLATGTLEPEDYPTDMAGFVQCFLLADGRGDFRARLVNEANVCFEEGETKFIVKAFAGTPDEMRFDFVIQDGRPKLSFVDCITLPIRGISEFPFSSFEPLPEKEAWIRAEHLISKMVSQYVRLKELFGTSEAMDWFRDGAGEALCAKAWVPYYTEPKSYVAYACWYESRINGEDVIIEVFTDDMCVVRFRNHLWFRMHKVTVHLRKLIGFDEYRSLFEHIWRDRAAKSGWEISFDYDGEDTVMIFSREL